MTQEHEDDDGDYAVTGGGVGGRIGHGLPCGASSGARPKHSSSSLMSRSFFRRFSLGHIVTLSRGGLNIFHKQNSDEVELSAAHNDPSSSAAAAAAVSKQSKARTAKTSVQVVREGTLRVVHGDSSAMMDGKPCWEKCRVALVKAAGGHMMEFFIPPKVSCPFGN